MCRDWSAVLVTVAALVAGACSIEAQSSGVDGTFDRMVQIASPADVRVTSRSGSIRVTTGASDQVHITARIRAFGSFVYSASEQVRRIESAPPIRREGNSVWICEISDPMLSSNVSISYVVTVPADARLRTSSRSGSQIIESLRGSVEATSRSGGIRLDDVKGPVRLGSRSGDVTVDGDPSGEWEIETRSGDVTLTVPSTASFDVEVETRSGSIRTSPAIESTGDPRRQGFRGRVGGGGAAIFVGTRSGSISIE
ncbi:MAG: DUF4097 family beta strand repeat protein [Luteitalea sp.]|nr:DUF4097 family beta strand repeat protein [Luteitalea sp.]